MPDTRHVRVDVHKLSVVVTFSIGDERLLLQMPPQQAVELASIIEYGSCAYMSESETEVGELQLHRLEENLDTDNDGIISITRLDGSTIEVRDAKSAHALAGRLAIAANRVMHAQGLPVRYLALDHHIAISDGFSLQIVAAHGAREHRFGEKDAARLSEFIEDNLL